MVEGYLRGIFDFKDDQPYSRARESVLLYFLEKEKFSKLYGNQVLMEASLISGLPKIDPGMVKNTIRIFEEFKHTTLPYLAEKGKMKVKDIKTVEQEWAEIIKARNSKDKK